jgi:antitoxin component YwqK of YwqJK toxin-antitoxin module
MNKDEEPYNDKGQQHGLWKVYSYKGNLRFKCFYYNGKEIGYEELCYHTTGNIHQKIYHL